MTVFDFGDGNGPVNAHQHSNGAGWVADTATVDDSAYIGPDALVYGNAWVCDHAWVYGNAQVFDNAFVCECSQVFDNARIYGNARIQDSARVFENAEVYGNSVIGFHTFIGGESKVIDHPLTTEHHID